MVLVQKPFRYIRHGLTDWNADKLCVGQVDVPLSEAGISQARAAASIVQKLNVTTVFHSPLKRARDTALLLSSGMSWRLVSEDGLKEVCLGIKEGQPEGNPRDDFVASWLAGYSIDEAEGFCDFRQRIVDTLNKCLAEISTTPPLIVAHSGVFMALASACGIRNYEIAHCMPCIFLPSPGGWVIEHAVD